MVVLLKQNPDKEQVEGLISWLEDKNLQVHRSEGASRQILGIVGDSSRLDIDLIAALDIVEDVKRVQEPYKSANRKFHPEDTVIKVKNTQIGGGTLTMMAGPCSVETEDQIIGVAKAVKAS
ncbi:MAG: 3-deoxy-7-phosphoheptulonate synthase, partial [Clostridia bacterium]|nr:3-deoxy-7-phosphoheptulonate synthase [Clostridia bacterium]